MNNIAIDIATPINAVLNAFISFWNWLDSVVLVPEYGWGFSLLQVFVASFCISWVLFLFFGFKGGEED